MSSVPELASPLSLAFKFILATQQRQLFDFDLQALPEKYNGSIMFQICGYPEVLCSYGRFFICYGWVKFWISSEFYFFIFQSLTRWHKVPLVIFQFISPTKNQSVFFMMRNYLEQMITSERGQISYFIPGLVVS